MMSSLAVLLLLGVGITISGVCAEKPGFQTRITQHALDYASKTSIDILATDIPKIKIPDQSGETGPLKYNLNNILIKSFNKPSGSIKLVPGTGLSWSATNGAVSLHSDWRVKFRKAFVKISTHGTVDVDVSGVSFTVVMAFGKDANGMLSIKSGSCSCQIGGIRIKIHGKMAFILDLFRSEIEKRVKSQLPGNVCGAMKQAIDSNAENALKKVAVKVPLLNNLFILDYSMVSPPSFQAAYMQSFHKGEVTWRTDPRAPPFSPSPLPPSTSTRNMMYLWVGEYVAQSFVYAAQQHGFLRYNVTANDLPPAERGFLNTTCTKGACVGMLVPSVALKYPHQTVELRMNSTSMPRVDMRPNLLEARATGDIAMFATGTAKPAAYLLTLHVSAVFNMTAGITAQLMKGNITGFSFRVKVVDLGPGIDPVKDTVLNTLMGFAMKFFIIPTINEQGNHGFPLPMIDKVKFVNSQLLIQQDAIMIGTDLKYTG